MTNGVLRSYSARLSRWLHEEAFPVWWEAGADQHNGGFVETIGLDGLPLSAPRRARVQPRQVYCYGEAGLSDWKGPWRQAMLHGMAFFDKAYLLPDGTFGALASADGRMIDSTFDLYNQAFALFAFAQMAKVLPSHASGMTERAEALLRSLRQRFGHPHLGFEEAAPRRLPLCSNPHMHMFEAALAWEAVQGRGVGPWSALADEIAELCMTRFIDARTGALREFFNGDWKRYPGEKGRVVEPGHQFEWAWLLTRWGTLRGSDEAIAKAKRLFEIGYGYGICRERKVAVMALRDDFSVLDPVARFWPQTEWVKGAIRLALVSDGAERDAFLTSAAEGCAALCKFLDVPAKGLWRDKMQPDGVFTEEAAPASTFYHVVCAIAELDAALQVLDGETGLSPITVSPPSIYHEPAVLASA